MSITLQVQPRGKRIKKLPNAIDVPASDTSEIYSAIARQTGYSIHRLRITNSSDGSLVPTRGSFDSTGLTNDGTIAVKDLGPQIPWRTVFVIEYLGPLLIHPVIYYLREHIYRSPYGLKLAFPAPSQVQTLSLLLVSIHFLKREFETLFVHRFSLATMPAFNIFKNSAHYWLLAGLNIAYWVYAPNASATTLDSKSSIVKLGLALFTIGELGNLYTHLVLRNLRPSGTTTRAIPQGFSFGLVTCPNYMFEIMAWIGISIVSWSWSTVLFTVVAGAQMAVWAQKKERRYRKEFGDKYKRKRFAMLPGLV